MSIEDELIEIEKYIKTLEINDNTHNETNEQFPNVQQRNNTTHNRQEHVSKKKSIRGRGTYYNPNLYQINNNKKNI